MNHLGGDMPTFALNFSRLGGQIVRHYHLMLLGKEGYRLIHPACYETAASRARESAALGPFEMHSDGDGARGYPGRFMDASPWRSGWVLAFDFSDRLRARGRQAAAYTMVQDITDVVVMRILVHRGLSQHMAHLLLSDIGRCLEYFETHPVAHSMTAADGDTDDNAVART